MSTTLTYTDIANMAIDWCGGALSIASIDDKQNPDAIVCARNLPQAIQTELDKYEWAFAQREAVAVKDETEAFQIPGYVCYELPKDFSRISNYLWDEQYHVRVSEYQYGHTYMVRQNRLYTKYPIETIPYISNNVPIAEWPALFADVVALNLAERICGKLKGMDADISFIESLYRLKLKDARRVELIQTEATQGGTSILQDNRMIP